MDFSPEELIRVGARRVAMPLVQQARATVEVAKSDGPALLALLPDPDFLQSTAAAADAVEVALSDRTVAEAESQDATAAQNDAFRASAVWRRKAQARSQRAARMGAKVPDSLLRLPRASSMASRLAALQSELALLEAYKSELQKAGGNMEALIEEGKQLTSTLASADATQEAYRAATYPKAVSEFHAAKGRLYYALKAINDAGRELHAGNPALSGRYNLSILYR